VRLTRSLLLAVLSFPLIVPANDAEFLLDVEINGVRQQEPALVRSTSTSGVLLRVADLTAWGVRTEDIPQTTTTDAEQLVPVTQLQGMRARIDFARQRLFVTAAPSLLPPVDIRLNELEAGDPAPSVPGAYLGYDVLGGYEGGSQFAAAQLEAGAFAGAWNTTGTWQVGAEDSVVGKRLDTSISREWPNRMLGLRLGDAITSAGYWGRAARIGGIRLGTDFRARPDFITFPLPAARGEAIVPSTVDVYVNGTLRARRDVQPGAFSMRDLPVVSGSGDVRLVVRDSLGREQVVEQPYFASEDLLRAGLSMYSVEIGAVREDYGLENFAYGRALAVAGVRRGLTDRLTAELRGEILKGQQTVGAGLVASVLPSVAVSASLAQSEAIKSGTLAQLGVDLDRRAFSAGVRVRTATATFRQLGMANDETAARRAIDAQVGWLAGRPGSFGLVFAQRDLRDRDDVRLLSLTYGISLRGLGYLGAFATHDLSRQGNSQAVIALTRSLGDRTSSRVSASIDSDGAAGGIAVNRSLPAGRGTGFHVEAEEGQFGRLAAGAAVRRDAVTLGADVERIEGYERYTGSARGGFVLVGRHLAAIRDISDETSFAVVEVPSLAGVPIYHDNHRVAVTDAHGFAVLPGLRPYESNRLQVDPSDLPIDTTIEASEYRVRPYRRGGVQVRFPVGDRGGAIVHLMRDANEPIPAGARVRVGTHEFTVARDGAVFVAGARGAIVLEVSWPGHRCSADVVVPADGELPDLGRVSCKEAL
jgi:outer membrane usher protein